MKTYILYCFFVLILTSTQTLGCKTGSTSEPSRPPPIATQPTPAPSTTTTTTTTTTTSTTTTTTTTTSIITARKTKMIDTEYEDHSLDINETETPSARIDWSDNGKIYDMIISLNDQRMHSTYQ